MGGDVVERKRLSATPRPARATTSDIVQYHKYNAHRYVYNAGLFPARGLRPPPFIMLIN